MKIRKTNSFFAVVLMLSMMIQSFCGIAAFAANGSGDIVILYTNDVHCGVDDAIGYDGLAAYIESMGGKIDSRYSDINGEGRLNITSAAADVGAVGKQSYHTHG